MSSNGLEARPMVGLPDGTWFVFDVATFDAIMVVSKGGSGLGGRPSRELYRPVTFFKIANRVSVYRPMHAFHRRASH